MFVVHKIQKDVYCTKVVALNLEKMLIAQALEKIVYESRENYLWLKSLRKLFIAHIGKKKGLLL